jgi:hypothetical protein
MTTVPADRATLLETIETQRFGCELSGSPLYSEVLEAVAGDVERGGPCALLLDPLARAPFGDAVILRFLGAVHRLVLAGEAPTLAAHFPSAGGTPHDGLAEVALETVAEHVDDIRPELGRGVQTNEVGRSAALIGGYLELARLGLPLRVLEVGASAGLNLNADRYRYEAGPDGDGDAFGPVDSPLVFRTPWFGRAPDLSVPLAIVERRGSDPAPIDAASPEGRLRLRSFIWPDQLDRLARLDAALEVAAQHPPVVDRADAVTWVRSQLAERVTGVTTVVVHSIVLQYLSPSDRTAFLRELDDAGRRATHDAPLAWLRLEPGGDQAELRLTTWPGGDVHLLAKSSYHGPPVVWSAPADGVVRRPGA